MSTLNPTKGISVLKYPTGEVAQNFIAPAKATVYQDATVASSTDPFAGKTNKFAESAVLHIYAENTIHVQFSSDGSTAATTASYPLPGGVIHKIAVDNSKPYLRIISGGTDGDVWTSEVY